MPFEKFIEALTGIEIKLDEVKEELNESNFLQHINTCIGQTKGIGGSMDVEQCLLLYALVRALRPEIVIETGVANGVSSSFILKALDRNDRGHLYSIDLPCREGISVPFGKHLGWIIPDELRYRWRLLLGESTKVLPRLLNSLKYVDIFLHDSRHLYKTMMKEYSIVWPFLRNGGF